MTTRQNKHTKDGQGAGCKEFRQGTQPTTFDVVYKFLWASSMAQQLKKKICLPMQETQKMQVRSPGQEDPLEKEMATHSSILA